MIIACPACNTRYVVPDSAIGLEGRTVRCAKCKHSWFQDGPEAEVRKPGPEAIVAKPRADTEPPAEESIDHHRSRSRGRRPERGLDDRHPGPADTSARRERVPAPASIAAPVSPVGQPSEAASGGSRGADDDRAPDFDSAEPPYDDIPDSRGFDEGGRDDADEPSQFDYAPPFRPRRNWIRVWTWAAAIFAILALGTVAAVNFFGVPDWVPIQRPLFATAEPDLTLEFPVEEQERRTLANGTEFFGARIIVTNEARESRDVPPVLIVLRDARERIVYSWEVVPPQGRLAPGETMTINEAITDVPKAAVFADIGWAPR